MKKMIKVILFVAAIVLSFSLVACSEAELYIGENGNWWNGDTDLEISAQGTPGEKGDTGEKGDSGKSAYQLYCEKYGYTGTEDEWLNALINGDLNGQITYTVTFDPANGDEVFTQTVKRGDKAKRPKDIERLGYTFLGWYHIDGNHSEKWSFSGYSVTEDITLTAKWDYATYELPIVNVNTNGAAINSKEEYTDMVFSIENCDDELFDITGGIRLRGNTTMKYVKKPYRIKFDSKQSLFGLDKAKSWVLLAEYLDPSALHNYTAFTLASELDGLSFTPTPHKLNVYLNGEFMGLYTLCEQVQENKGRIDIELDEITEDMVDLKQFNFLIAMDHSVRLDIGAVADEDYFYVEEFDRYFELKYPEKDQFPSEEQFNSFMQQLKEYVIDLYRAFQNKDYERIKAEANVNSLIDYLIVDIIMAENDHAKKSFNMYYTNTSHDPRENGKLSFGPIWDYDWTLNTPFTEEPNESYELNSRVNYSNVYFQAVRDIPELYGQLKERYTNHAAEILENYIDGLDELYESMDESIQLNQERWYSDLDEEISYQNVKFLKDFLTARKKLLDTMWAIS